MPEPCERCGGSGMEVRFYMPSGTPVKAPCLPCGGTGHQPGWVKVVREAERRARLTNQST
jgi:hypothetical protein